MSPSVFRYMRARHLKQFLDGEILFRPLAEFHGFEEQRARHDRYEGTLLQRRPVVTNTRTGEQFVPYGGDTTAIHAAEMFILYTSEIRSCALALEFESDACVEIVDVEAFASRLRDVVMAKSPTNVWKHEAVHYYDPDAPGAWGEIAWAWLTAYADGPGSLRQDRGHPSDRATASLLECHVSPRGGSSMEAAHPNLPCSFGPRLNRRPSLERAPRPGLRACSYGRRIKPASRPQVPSVGTGDFFRPAIFPQRFCGTRVRAGHRLALESISRTRGNVVGRLFASGRLRETLVRVACDTRPPTSSSEACQAPVLQREHAERHPHFAHSPLGRRARRADEKPGRA
jgi:hypothetical protein